MWIFIITSCFLIEWYPSMSKQILMDCFLPSYRVESYHDTRIVPYSYQTPPMRFTDHRSLFSFMNLNQILYSTDPRKLYWTRTENITCRLKNGINQSCKKDMVSSLKYQVVFAPTCRRISRHFDNPSKRNLCIINLIPYNIKQWLKQESGSS